MFGFDNYLPSKWLDGILAIHVAEPRGESKRVVRTGQWVAKGVVSATLLVTGLVSVAAEPLPASVLQIVPSAQGYATRARDALEAPPGYFAKLTAAIARSPRLPDQSTLADPEFAF